MKVTCPKCHKELEIPDDKPTSMKCPHCNATLTFKYSDNEGDESKQETEKIPLKLKAKDFWNKHKVKIIVGVATVIGTIATIVWHKNRESSEESSRNLLDSLPKLEPDKLANVVIPSNNEPEESQDDEYYYGNGDEYSDDDEEFDCEEWGILGYLSNYCYNCGAKLSNGLYTDPWEDGSNEYGYWTCLCCGAINEDYNSADD